MNNIKTTIPIKDNDEARLPIHNSDNRLWSVPEGELAIDVFVTDEAVVVRAPVAGVDPAQLSVSLHNDLITIRGSREEKFVNRNARFVVQECHWGAFSRSVVLPVEVEAGKTESVLEDGVLYVTLPRMTTRQVTIKS
jgi:HSP20 family protein